MCGCNKGRKVVRTKSTKEVSEQAAQAATTAVK